MSATPLFLGRLTVGPPPWIEGLRAPDADDRSDCSSAGHPGVLRPRNARPSGAVGPVDEGESPDARIGLGRDPIQVQRVECRLQQGASGLCRVAVSPRRIVKAGAHRRAVVVRVPPGQSAASDERLVGDTVHGQPRPAAFVRHAPASRDKALGPRTFATGWRISGAQHVGAAVQREEGVRAGLRLRR
jgi:hypothetical protein